MKDLCESVTALHDALPHNRTDKMMVHPVIRVHPVTGQKALYVNEHFTRRIVEMNASESEMLLSYLTPLGPKPPIYGQIRLDRRHDWDLGQPVHPTHGFK